MLTTVSTCPVYVQFKAGNWYIKRMKPVFLASTRLLLKNECYPLTIHTIIMININPHAFSLATTQKTRASSFSLSYYHSQNMKVCSYLQKVYKFFVYLRHLLGHHEKLFVIIHLSLLDEKWCQHISQRIAHKSSSFLLKNNGTYWGVYWYEEVWAPMLVHRGSKAPQNLRFFSKILGLIIVQGKFNRTGDALSGVAQEKSDKEMTLRLKNKTTSHCLHDVRWWMLPSRNFTHSLLLHSPYYLHIAGRCNY